MQSGAECGPCCSLAWRTAKLLLGASLMLAVGCGAAASAQHSTTGQAVHLGHLSVDAIPQPLDIWVKVNASTAGAGRV